VLAIPVTIAFPLARLYLFFLLPFGLVAALLARIALNQMKHTPAARADHRLAVVAYFLGFSPIVYFCAILTSELLTLQ